jgi:hypothetical protein
MTMGVHESRFIVGMFVSFGVFFSVLLLYSLQQSGFLGWIILACIMFYGVGLLIDIVGDWYNNKRK